MYDCEEMLMEPQNIRNTFISYFQNTYNTISKSELNYRRSSQCVVPNLVFVEADVKSAIASLTFKRATGVMKSRELLS